MEKSPINFRKEVIKALNSGIITKVEAKECLNRGFTNEELPLFFDFSESENDPIKHYILGLEKMGLINPLFREDE